MRTTLGRAPRTRADCSARVSGGVDGGAGPAIDGNGSMRLNARRTERGGAILFSCCTILEPSTSSRIFGWPGSCVTTAASTQTTTKPIAAPASRPPSESSMRSGGRTKSALRSDAPGERRGGLDDHRADHRPDEPGERRVRRARAVVQEMRRKPRADDCPGREARERERSRDQAPPQSAERRDGGDAERDPVDARHAGRLERRRDGAGGIYERCTERPRQRAMRRTVSDDDRARGRDAVASREVEQQTGQRRAAPADGRPSRMRADGVLVRARLAGTPVEDEVRRVRLGSVRVECGCGNEHSRDPGPLAALESDPFDVREPFVVRPALRARVQHASGMSACESPARVRASFRSSSGLGSDPKRSSSRSTMFTCACASGVSIQRSSRARRAARPSRRRGSAGHA